MDGRLGAILVILHVELRPAWAALPTSSPALTSLPFLEYQVMPKKQ